MFSRLNLFRTTSMVSHRHLHLTPSTKFMRMVDCVKPPIRECPLPQLPSFKVFNSPPNTQVRTPPPVNFLQISENELMNFNRIDAIDLQGNEITFYGHIIRRFGYPNNEIARQNFDALAKKLCLLQQ
jgi:hypothetical protein